MHWTEALTDRLVGKVKMVGATISCGGVYDVPAVPHVQSYLVAVDQTGFNVLRKAVRFTWPLCIPSASFDAGIITAEATDLQAASSVLAL